VVSDNGFAAAGAQFQSQFAARMPVANVSRDSQSDAEARSAVLSRINAGPSVVHYTGHGSVGVWANSGLLRTEDAGQLANANGLSVYVMLTCLNGYYHDLYSETLGAALLRAPGGAVAAWASSGLPSEAQQTQMARSFYQQWLASGARLGDAVRFTKGATNDQDVRRT
jgi:hypothetical protein